MKIFHSPSYLRNSLKCYSVTVKYSDQNQPSRRAERTQVHMRKCVRVFVRVHAHVLYSLVWVCTGQRKTKSFNFLLHFVWAESVDGLELARASWPVSFMDKIVSTPISPLLGAQACAITLGFFRWVLKITRFYLAVGFWIRFLMLLRQVCSWLSYFPGPQKDVAFSTFKVKLSRVKR